MLLQTDVTNIFLTLFQMLLDHLALVIHFARDITILNTTILGFDVTLFDLWIGITVFGLVFGSFYIIPRVLDLNMTRGLYR